MTLSKDNKFVTVGVMNWQENHHASLICKEISKNTQKRVKKGRL
jgi:hypothetical protein